MTSTRPFAERARAFALGAIAGGIGAFLFVHFRDPTTAEAAYAVAPIAALVMGLAVERVLGGVHGKLRLVRLGTLEEKKAAYAAPHGLGSRMIRAAIAIDAGDLVSAAERIAEKREGIEFSALEELVTMNYELARGGDKNGVVLGRLLAMEPAGSFISGEIDRYYAYIVANVLAESSADAKVRAVVTRFLAHRDVEVRGYGTWLVFADEEVARASSADFATGAALAKSAGRMDLAALLDSRASKAATAGKGGPYRAG